MRSSVSIPGVHWSWPSVGPVPPGSPGDRWGSSRRSPATGVKRSRSTSVVVCLGNDPGPRPGERPVERPVERPTRPGERPTSSSPCPAPGPAGRGGLVAGGDGDAPVAWTPTTPPPPCFGRVVGVQAEAKRERPGKRWVGGTGGGAGPVEMLSQKGQDTLESKVSEGLSVGGSGGRRESTGWLELGGGPWSEVEVEESSKRAWRASREEERSDATTHAA